jgi:hypothetical protein
VTKEVCNKGPPEVPMRIWPPGKGISIFPSNKLRRSQAKPKKPKTSTWTISFSFQLWSFIRLSKLFRSYFHIGIKIRGIMLDKRTKPTNSKGGRQCQNQWKQRWVFLASDPPLIGEVVHCTDIKPTANRFDPQIKNDTHTGKNPREPKWPMAHSQCFAFEITRRSARR